MATQTVWSGVIAYDFSENPGNQVLDTVTPKGPLGTTFWNDSNAEGAPASGSESNLVDGTGTPTSASITWSSANTWFNGSGTGSENARLLVGYLDDGGSGLSVTLNNIPYAKYNVYGIVGSDVGSEYTTRDFRINGSSWALPAILPQYSNAGSLGSAGTTSINASSTDPGSALAGSSDPSIAITGGQIVKVPYNAALNPAGAFTVEAWLKPGAALAPGGLTTALSSVFVANPRKGWLIYQSDTGWNFRTYNENGTATAVNITGGKNGEAAPVVGTWYHVVAVWDGSVGKVYVDGELRATSAPTTYIPTATTDFHLGSRSDGTFVWTGGQDEVAFYNFALSDAVIANHYANGIDPGRTTPYQTLIQASNPVAYWTGATIPVPSRGGGPAYGTWQGAGQEWIRINPATNQRGNYWRVDGLTGPTCTIQGLNSGAGRGSLSSVIIEEVVVQTQLVNTGIETFPDVVLASGLTSQFRLGLDQVTVGNPDGFGTAATHSIEITPRPGVASGTYPLIDYTGTIGGSGFAGLSLNPIPNPRYGVTLVDNAAGTSVDVAYVAPTPVVWTGATDTEWADVATQNWKLESDSSPTRFHPFDVVKFDDTPTSGAVNITSSVNPVSMVVNNSTLPYEFSGGAIAGTSSLTKTGAGVLTIGTANTFTGPVEILGGTVNVSAGSNLGASGSGNTLAINGGTLRATQSLTLPRRMTIPGAGELEVDDTFQVTSSGGFNGGGTLTKTGPGAVRFENYGAGGFSGSLVIEAGSAVFAGGAFNGNIGVTSITVAGGASLIQPAGAFHALGGYFANTPVINLEENATFVINQENYFTTINMTGAILSGTNEVRTDSNFAANILESTLSSVWSARVNSVNSAMTFNVADGAASPDLLMNGLLTNTQAFVKNGPGTMELTAANTFTGNTTVNAGTLALSGAGGIATSPVVDVKAGAFIDASPLGFPWTVPQMQRVTGGGTVTGDVEWFGTLEPGATAGTMTVDGELLIGGASQYVWEVSDWSAGAVAGTGYDTLVADSAEIFASSANPMFITIKPSALSGFTEENRSFTLLQTTGGITGFSADAFDIDDSALDAVALNYGTWKVELQGNNLVLVYTAGAPTAFQTWIAGPPYNLSGPSAEAGADPDKDGIPNAIEFVLGGDPAAADDSGKLPTGEVVGANFEFTFRRSDLSNYAPVPFAEYGSNLSGWTPVASTTVTDDFYGPGIDRVVASVPLALATNGRIFVRLNANP